MNFDNRIESSSRDSGWSLSCDSNRDRDQSLSLLDFVTLQVQDFSGLSGSRNRTIQLGGNASNAGHQFRIALGQHSLAIVNIVFEAHTHVSTHSESHHAQGQLMPSYSRYTPGTAGRKTAYHMYKVRRVGTNTTRHTHHKIKMHRVSYQARCA